MGDRVRVYLVCSLCGKRNYQTTRKLEQQGQIELKKFCSSCKKHSLHKESK